MHRRFFSVEFSAALLVVVLPSGVEAQEDTTEETTVLRSAIRPER
jgi:hypothetical protein